MDKKVKISICIPTFNRDDLIGETLESVVSQTIKPYEIIVVDNASTDSTPKIVSEFRRYGVKYIRNKINLGLTGNYNRCIALATGTHLSIVHSDDLIAPSWHEEWLSVIKNFPADIYTSAFVVIGNKRQIRITHHPFRKNRHIPEGKVLENILPRYFPLVGPTGATVYCIKLFKSMGGFNESCSTESDADFFLKIQDRVSIYFHNKILFAHRFHDQQTFEFNKKPKTFSERLYKMKNYFQIIRMYERKLKVKPSLKRRFWLTHVLMTLTSTNLYLISGRIKDIIMAHKITKKIFPEIFTGLTDWKMYLFIQMMMVYRAVFGKLIALKDYREIVWLKNISNQSPPTY